MMVIDEHVEESLLKTLEQAKLKPEAVRCIYWHLADEKNKAAARTLIIEHLPRYLPSPQLQVFLCGDGDIFIMAPALPVKEARMFMMDMTTKLQLTDRAELVELEAQAGKLLMIAQQKFDRVLAGLETIKKQKEQENAERRRHAILSATTFVQNPAASIADKRAAHTQPEIMIIEDDAFSRRLVENVLQKQFHLTGLGTANAALSTYASVAPDLLFLDINLPDVTGHELLEKIMQMDPNAYVIMLSGNADRENIMKALSMGAKGFVAKPFTREKLFQYSDRCPTMKKAG